jgi:radical SAM protein with 4Fe4S-binding SPASM domain
MQDAGQLGGAGSALRESDSVELAHRLRIAERRVPIEGLVETTFRCNLRCAHCYVNAAAQDRETAARELSLERLTRLIDEIAAAGCLFLTFSGGEPLLRPDFPELYRHALRAGLIVSVFTNGTLVSDALADLFEEWRPEYVEISLYGMSAATYERVTRAPGSHARCLAGLERLRARGIAVRLKTMALAWNAAEIAEMDRFARSLDLPFRFDGQLNARVDCGASRCRELQLTPEALCALDTRFGERLAEMRSLLERTGTSAATENGVYACGAGRTTFTVDPYGRLLLCPLSRRVSFDLEQGSFAEGWAGTLAAARQRVWRSASPCRRCSLISLCDSCPGANELETGDVEKPVALFCETAHRRAAAALGEIPGHRADGACCLRAEPPKA